MLTLDETTLFYFTLACNTTTSSRALSTSIQRWEAETLKPLDGPKCLSSRASTTVAASTVSSRISSAQPRYSAPSTLTNNITITSTAQPKVKAEPVSDLEGHVISDNDETQGPEHDEAATSPVKGTTRKDSSVCILKTYTSWISADIKPCRTSSSLMIPPSLYVPNNARVMKPPSPNSPMPIFLRVFTTKHAGSKYSSPRSSGSFVASTTLGVSTTKK